MSLQFEVTIFKDLVEKYPTWNDLRSYLESEEGGLFRVVHDDKKEFCLIRYEKDVSIMNLPHSRWFRSVVWNTVKNRPVCIAPPKASSGSFPFSTINEMKDAGVLCQELMDGFMINCFRYAGDDELHITSRSKLNAAGKFYSEKSFRELFNEVYTGICNLSEEAEKRIQEDSNDIESPDSLKGQIAIFYSFLVQHKEHRIVTPNIENELYVIHKGIVYEDGRIELEDSPMSFRNKLNMDSISYDSPHCKDSYAKALMEKTDEEGEEIKNWIRNILTSKSWKFQGIVIKDKFGNRWRFRSDKYLAVKSLRGNAPSIQERFAKLYTQNLIQKYLEYYPEEMLPMTVNLMIMNSLIKVLYDSYVDIHITKTKQPEEISKVYLPYLYSIHGIYLTQLKPNGKKITMNEIMIYIHRQPWQKIAFLIKKSIDNTT